MATKQVTAAELKTLDPRRFEKEYWEWVSHCAVWGDWYEYIETQFKEAVKPFGVEVDDITYNNLGSCGASAAFDGRIRLYTFMETVKRNDVPLSELYPAMYLAVKYDESAVRVVTGRRGQMTVTIDDNTSYVAPLGIFSGLENYDWQKLIEDQWGECDPYTTIEGFLDDKCGDLARDLEAEYESITSEEAFFESCECNEITFELEIEDEAEFCG